MSCCVAFWTGCSAGTRKSSRRNRIRWNGSRVCSWQVRGDRGPARAGSHLPGRGEAAIRGTSGSPTWRSATGNNARYGWTCSTRGSQEGYFRPDLDVDLVYRFIRDTTWDSVRSCQPGGPLTADQVGRQYLAIVLGGIRRKKESDMAMSSEAYVVDAVRTAVGKRNGSLAGVHPVDPGRRRGAACSARGRRSRRGRRRDRGLRRRDRTTGRKHRAAVLAGRRLSGRGARCHR